jgi:hypothetical protein
MNTIDIDSLTEMKINGTSFLNRQQNNGWKKKRENKIEAMTSIYEPYIYAPF